jgi:two-component system, LytTR family, response regulator
MIINCIIVEDEPLALKRAAEFVGKVPCLNLLRSFDNGFEALAFMKTEKVDLIFLDIKMDELTGIQLIESLTVRPYIIITTAFNKYALKGYDLGVTDYLLKPYTFERFMQSIDKVFSLMNLISKNERDYIFVKTEHRMEKIMHDEILYIEGMRDYRSVQTTGKRIMTLQTFTDLEQELPKSFCRVHKSYLVSLNKITSVERNRIKIGDKLIPIGETYKARFYDGIGVGE